MQSENLIQALSAQTRAIVNEAENLKTLDLNVLRWRQHPTSWSILECLEHLNLYGEFYLPQMEREIRTSATKPDEEFRSGVLGGYFAKSMLPKEKLNKMKTFKDKNPLNAQLDKTTIHTFIAQQSTLLDLLDRSRKVSLNSVRIRTSILVPIKLKLGDTFQFFINHILRHLNQIDNVLIAWENAKHDLR